MDCPSSFNRLMVRPTSATIRGARVIHRIIQGLKPRAAIRRGWSRTPFNDDPNDDDTKVAIMRKANVATTSENQYNDAALSREMPNGIGRVSPAIPLSPLVTLDMR